jgi:hypothetical protein
MRVPAGMDLKALKSELPAIAVYPDHYMFHLSEQINGKVLWANIVRTVLAFARAAVSSLDSGIRFCGATHLSNRRAAWAGSHRNAIFGGSSYRM